MTIRTLKLSTFEDYLQAEREYGTVADAEANTEANTEERTRLLASFPHAVMLEAAYPELDFANRWCWANFGPAHGECLQSFSDHPACTIAAPHCHAGTWAGSWFLKTEYNFGFNEWYFADAAMRDAFLGQVDSFHWGELHPKSP